MVIIDLIERVSVLSFKLNFSCTNNKVKYEAAITDLLTAKKLGAKKVTFVGHSNLVIQQINDVILL